ncbi:histone-like nucleoid-structuring protein Lsr2 [Williamsia sterculiae]|uniref:Lsr2 protein n=1 Tax=Williamsia sterculiae TaxID=1344003 RepID=A0A1N7HE07_9NOCA|nr:Lsr2 family protein [Williamsia sterculiae]SIS23114.1 Lsr2 protein [Williamsia sterculiae]
MAQQRLVQFTDDLDGKDLALDDAHTVSWAWSGVEYEIDVSTANLDKIVNGKVPVSALLERSTRVGGRVRSTAPKTTTSGGRSTPAITGREQTHAVREWARANGYEVADRGRIPVDVVEAFNAAH